MTRFELINELIKRYNYTSYLEIGLSTGHCFREVECQSKTWIDPQPLCEEPGGIYMPSDDAFAAMDEDTKYDIIFIDGDHRHQQVLRDIDNSLEYLSYMGTIVMHDCNPQTKTAQLPYPTTGDWNGDVWKAFVHRRNTLKDTCVMMTIDTDQGLGIIRRLDDFSLVANAVRFKHNLESLSWELLEKNRDEILRLLTVDQFLAWDIQARSLHEREK